MRFGVTSIAPAVVRGPGPAVVEGRIQLARPNVAYLEFGHFVVSAQKPHSVWPPNAVVVRPTDKLSDLPLGGRVWWSHQGISWSGGGVEWDEAVDVIECGVNVGACRGQQRKLERFLLERAIRRPGVNCAVCAATCTASNELGRDAVWALHALANRSLGRAIGLGTLLCLLGQGPGLTPELDDVVCGAVVTQRALGVSVNDVLGDVWAFSATKPDARTTAVSATLLRLAIMGETIRPVWELLCGKHGFPVWQRAVETLRAVGSSTGSAYIAGITIALAGAARATCSQGVLGRRSTPFRRN